MEHTTRLFMSLEDAQEIYSEDNQYFEGLSQLSTINMNML